MSRKTTFKLAILTVGAIFILLLTTGCSKAWTVSRSVKGPMPDSHLVKCNPGDSFTVSVASNLETTVTIVALTPISAPPNVKWGENNVAKSPKGTSHYLEYGAPDKKPTAGAAYWHYEVRIRPSTDRWTDYTIEVNQRGSGAKNQDQAYVERAQKQVVSLVNALYKRRGAHETKVGSIIEDIKKRKDYMLNWRKDLNAEKAEIDSYVDRIKAEPDEGARNNLINQYKRRIEQFQIKADNFNKKGKELANLSEQQNSEFAEIEKINNLLKALINAYNNNDYDQCVLIANGNDLARSLGWVPMIR